VTSLQARGARSISKSSSVTASIAQLLRDLRGRQGPSGCGGIQRERHPYPADSALRVIPPPGAPTPHCVWSVELSPATPGSAPRSGRRWATPAGSAAPTTPSGTPGSTSRSTPQMDVAALGTWPGKARPCCAGHCRRPRSTPDVPAPPTTPTSSRSKPASTGNSRCCRWPASSPGAATTPCATSTSRSSPPQPDRITAA
jgi:hypothetical protein